NVIDTCTYPDARIGTISKAFRRIGLGVMGYADLLIRLGVPYDSAEAVSLSDRLASFIERVAWAASEDLAVERGPFPKIGDAKLEIPARNCAVTAIAPTGTISMIAECSSGIEPRFAPYFRKDVINDSGVEYWDEELVASLVAERGITEGQAKEMVKDWP